MNASTIYLQPAYIIQHRKFRETSLIIDVLTRDYGIISVLAKGVRKKNSKTAGLLQTFTYLIISYVGIKELKTLTHVELDTKAIRLSGISLYCGFYVNELVNFFLHKNDPHPEIFAEYHQCLVKLENSTDIEQILRFFELNLLEHIGYGIQLTLDVNTDKMVHSSKMYCYSGELGMVENINGYVSGKTLLTMSARKSLDEQALYEAKQLMRRMIDFQLQGKELKSRVVLAKIFKQL